MSWKFVATEINFAQVVERAVLTAVEAFLSFVTIEAIVSSGAVDVLKAGAVAAGGALLSAAINLVRSRKAEVNGGE